MLNYGMITLEQIKHYRMQLIIFFCTEIPDAEILEDDIKVIEENAES
jgi:hypothetical protein